MSRWRHGPHGRHDPHGRHEPRWRYGNPVAFYFRMRMHRRIFVWFGASIIGTMLVSFLVMGLSGSGHGWRKTMLGVRSLGASRFERVWDDPAARDELARSLSQDLAVDVTVRDARAGTAAVYGAPCDHPDMAADIVRNGTALGTVQVCYPAAFRGSRWSFFAPLIVAALVLWAASGRIARRLTRPIGELVRVTQEIGGGNLEARAKVNPFRHGEVGLLGESINDMAARIQQQLADQRELLAAVSHELRTPLARIRILAELLRTGPVQPKTLDDLDREVVEIDALVGDLLASARMDFSALTLHRLDAVTVARRALERAGVSAEKLHVDALDTQLEGDATLLARALANLLDNALRHGGGVVAVHVKTRPNAVAFEVEDSGPGFQAGEEARAFDGFYHRPKDPERDPGGLGLGLSLVRRIAEAHGGRAYAERREGGGARVGFEVSAKPKSA